MKKTTDRCHLLNTLAEVSGSLDILKMFDVSGKVVTTDALLTQRRFSELDLQHHAQ